MWDWIGETMCASIPVTTGPPKSTICWPTQLKARHRDRPFTSTRLSTSDRVSTGSTYQLRTSGAGFLGCTVVETLRAWGATEICVPRSRDYDLVQREAVLEMLHDARPDLIIHLAASVENGVGA